MYYFSKPYIRHFSMQRQPDVFFKVWQPGGLMINTALFLFGSLLKDVKSLNSQQHSESHWRNTYWIENEKRNCHVFCGAREDSLRVPWTVRKSNQSILKEIRPEYSLEGLKLKVKLQYFGHLMRRTDSLEKPLMLGKIEGRRIRGWQRMR